MGETKWPHHENTPMTRPNWRALQHSANEWADMAINGLQWLRNIVDGTSDPKKALANMEKNLVHCRSVNDAEDVQRAIRFAAQPAPQPAAQQGKPSEYPPEFKTEGRA